MSYSRIDDPKLWRERAEEARRIAEMLADLSARTNMRRIAEACEEMAERAERNKLTRDP
jgi:hypothetical protein